MRKEVSEVLKETVKRMNNASITKMYPDLTSFEKFEKGETDFFNVIIIIDTIIPAVREKVYNNEFIIAFQKNSDYLKERLESILENSKVTFIFNTNHNQFKIKVDKIL
jgi:hypothetical protein